MHRRPVQSLALAFVLAMIATLMTIAPSAPASAQDVRDAPTVRAPAKERAVSESDPPAAPTPGPTVGPGPEGPILFALGDSFASGEGAPIFTLSPFNPQFSTMKKNGWPLWTQNPVIAPIGVTTAACHRSVHAAALRLMNDLRVGALQHQVQRTNFVACSGATTPNLWAPQGWNQPPQLRIFADETNQTAQRIITVSIGGNDLGFAEIIGRCIKTDDCTADAAFIASVDQRVLNHSSLLRNAYEGIATANGTTADAAVFVAGGPKLFDETCGTGPVPSFSTVERAYLNDLVATIDAISDAVVDQTEAEWSNPAHTFYRPNMDIEYVSMLDDFAGHTLCNILTGTPGEWVLPFSVPLSYSFHPNADGQRARADLLQTAIEAWPGW